MNYGDAGDFMPVSLISEVNFKAGFELDGFWQDTCGRLIIEDMDDNIVGVIGCFKTTHYIDGREVFYRIFSGHRRKGYAKQALELFVEFFFQSTPLNRLQAVTLVDNQVSSNMLQKRGFQFEGTLRGARWFKGSIVDLNLYSFLRVDWLENK